MRYQYRFAIGLAVSSLLHAGVLVPLFSSHLTVRTPEQKTTVFRVKVLQPRSVPASETVQVATATPPQKMPEKPMQAKKIQTKVTPKKTFHTPRLKPPPKPVLKAKRKMKPVDESSKRIKPVAQVANRDATARLVASAGRVASIEDEYRALVRKEIEKHKFYPMRARRQRTQGTVAVAFALEPNGHYRELRVIKKSGSSVLDRAALEAVKKVSTFPPFPHQVQRLSWAFEIPLSYRIR